jgi:hypothetical protein
MARDNVCDDSDQNNVIPELDCPITKAEIQAEIKNAKRGKSCGSDGVLSEMLKAGVAFVIDFLERLFNTVFDSGFYPDEWAKAIIVPIYKKGNPNIPDNYRGISIVSVVCKCYTSILNRRLYNWLEVHDKIAENQAGFRKDYSTSDQIFNLYSVVQKYLCQKGKKLYVGFVDLKKAFDSVQHNILLNALRQDGVHGKFLTAIESMYSSLLACVRSGNEYSEFFECPAGVRQGCVLSPTLFSVVINKLAKHINEFGTHGIQLSPLFELFILLFADDVALLSDTPGGLQNQFNLLKLCCEKLKLTVNKEKTKVMVFRNGGILNKYEKWVYEGQPLEVVNSFCYLGYTFTPRLSPAIGVENLVSKAKKALFLICRAFFNCTSMSKEVYFKMFDAKVQSILLYSSEIWGFFELNNLEVVHMQACKRFLGVPTTTPNKMVYGDLHRHPLYILSSMRAYKYWIRLLKMDDKRLPKICYNMLVSMDVRGKSCWATQVRTFLGNLGFHYIWLEQNAQDAINILPYIKQRLIDNFAQEWQSCVSSSSRFVIYRDICEGYFDDNYMFKIHVFCYRKAYCQLRFGVLPINGNMYRYSISSVDRLCPWCHDCVEDEIHFAEVCPMYSDLRRKCCPLLSKEPLYLYINGKCMTRTQEMAKFVFLALKLRRKSLSL